MRVTKFEHACLLIESGGKALVIDPGSYTRNLDDLGMIAAVVITHTHDDHCSEAQLERLLAKNPELQIFGPAEVVTRLAKYRATTVYHGDRYEVAGFSVEFYGDLHQEIHRSIPLVQNTGIFVNDTLYYPGDSYTQPDREIPYLACPASAPWLKIGDVMDFLAATKPAHCFPTHNALLSELGHSLNNGRIKLVTEQNGGEFRYLLPGESWELAV